MGFFSRLFATDSVAQDKPGKSGKSATADTKNRASEINLDAKTAAAVLAEIDIDTAISAHDNWKIRLQSYLNGQSTEDLKPELVCMDDRCDLGKWLHGPGELRLGSYPAFSMLLARHKYFHVQASTVLALAQAQDTEKAEQMLQGSYRQASNQVIFLLKELKRGLGG